MEGYIQNCLKTLLADLAFQSADIAKCRCENQKQFHISHSDVDNRPLQSWLYTNTNEKIIRRKLLLLMNFIFKQISNFSGIFHRILLWKYNLPTLHSSHK